MLFRSDQRYARIAQLRSEQIRLEQELEAIKAKGTPTLTMDNIARVIEMWTKIPASKIKEEEFQRLSQLETRLKKHIVGQDEAVAAVAAAIRRNRVGISPKQEDIVVNVCKKKQLTNTRAAGSDDALRLVPPRKMSLEQCLEFLADDELLEVTPKSLRMRKTILNHEKRMKATHGGKKN